MGPEADHILPGKQGLLDTGQIMFYVCCDAFTGYLSGQRGNSSDEKPRFVAPLGKKQMARMFPTLRPVEFEEAWHGQIALTPDHLPRIYELAKNLFTPIGYNGRGITPAPCLVKRWRGF